MPDNCAFQSNMVYIDEGNIFCLQDVIMDSIQDFGKYDKCHKLSLFFTTTKVTCIIQPYGVIHHIGVSAL